jgi:hypothetical protein
MPSANVTRLQNAINRFATASHLPSMGPAFNTIGVDGGLGPQTNQGTLNALAWIARYGDHEQIDTAAGLVDKLTNGDLQTNIAQSAAGLAEFLESTADDMSLSAPSTSSTTPSSGGIVPPRPGSIPVFSPTGSGITAKVMTFWNGLQTWQKIALGVGAGALVVWGTGQQQEAKKSSSKRRRA